MSKVKKKHSKRKTAAPAPADSRAALIQAAQKCFGTEGYDRTSTRDIAKAAGVNISLISYHFQGKEGLLRACLEEMSAGGVEMAERVLKKPTSIEDFKTRLQIFTEEFLRVHMQHSDTSCLMLREITTGTPNPIVIEMFKSRFVIVFEKLVDFLSSAQKQKLMAADQHPEMAAMMVMGCITHLLRSETMRKAVLGVPGLLEEGQISKTCAQLTGQLLNGMLPRN